MAVLVSELEGRVSKAEENVTKLENELSVTKGKLAEAEAHLIVSRREKEIAETKKQDVPQICNLEPIRCCQRPSPTLQYRLR